MNTIDAFDIVPQVNSNLDAPKTQDKSSESEMGAIDAFEIVPQVNSNLDEFFN